MRCYCPSGVIDSIAGRNKEAGATIATVAPSIEVDRRPYVREQDGLRGKDAAGLALLHATTARVFVRWDDIERSISLC